METNEVKEISSKCLAIQQHLQIGVTKLLSELNHLKLSCARLDVEDIANSALLTNTRLSDYIKESEQLVKLIREISSKANLSQSQLKAIKQQIDHLNYTSINLSSTCTYVASNINAKIK